MIIASSSSSMPEAAPSLGALLSLSASAAVESGRAWGLFAAAAVFLTCLVSDLRLGLSRSAYKARWDAQPNSPGVFRTRVFFCAVPLCKKRAV